MDEENGESEKKFPGLFGAESVYRSDSDYVESSPERLRRESLIGPRRERPSDLREKGYATLQGGESSDDDMDSIETRPPKSKKSSKSFKFLHSKKDKEKKEEKRDEKRRKEKDEKDDKKKEKKKEKEELRREKEEKKKIKKDKKRRTSHHSKYNTLPLFGVPLSVTVERNPCHDGIPLPSLVRESIDFVELKGLATEGIYRLGGVKSHIQLLKRRYNSGERVELIDEHPLVVASLLKLFLKELPEPVLTTAMMHHFHDVSLIPNPHERAEAMRQLIMRLPLHNQVLLQYILKHMGNVIRQESETKMSHQSVCIVLSPLLQIPHRVLNVMFLSHAILLKDVKIVKYIAPLSSSNFNQSMDVLQVSSDIKTEIGKQESLLAFLHRLVASGLASRQREEELWDAQRILTLLKRRLKSALRKESGIGSSQDRDGSSEDSQEGPRFRIEKEMEVEVIEKYAEKSDQIRESVIREDSSEDLNEGANKDLEENHENPPGNGELVDETSCDSKKLDSDNVDGNESSTVPIYPTLPMPVSAKEEKYKMKLQRRSNEKIESTAESKELKEIQKGANNVVSLSIVSGNDIDLQKGGTALPARFTPDFQREISSHVTVIQVGNDELPVISTDKINDHVIEPDFPVSISKISLNDDATNLEKGKHCNDETPQDEFAITNDKDIYNYLENRRKKDSLIYIRESESPTNEWTFDRLLEEESRLLLEHEEMLQLNQNLTKRLQSEKSEIRRLKEEIQEMQTLYGYRTNVYDSSESDGSNDSDGDSDTEEDIAEQIEAFEHANKQIELENSTLVMKIQDERETVISLRVALKVAQNKENKPDVPQQHTTICVESF